MSDRQFFFSQFQRRSLKKPCASLLFYLGHFVQAYMECLTTLSPFYNQKLQISHEHIIWLGRNFSIFKYRRVQSTIQRKEFRSPTHSTSHCRRGRSSTLAPAFLCLINTFFIDISYIEPFREVDIHQIRPERQKYLQFQNIYLFLIFKQNKIQKKKN